MPPLYYYFFLIMTQKTLIRTEHASRTHMVGDGFRVAQLMPGYGQRMNPSTSPFLMMDYNAPWQVPAQGGHRPGVGYHPHRGFETVTIAYAGEIEHHDTSGNHGIIKSDEVQWMTAGAGLLHNEYMSTEFSKTGGTQHMVQLWVDLPKKDKLTAPRYQALTQENIPEIPFAHGIVRVLAGAYEGHEGAAKTFSPIRLWDIRFKSDGTFTTDIPAGWNTLVLTVENDITLNGKAIQNASLAYLSLAGESVEITAKAGSKVLLLAGEPLDQPVVNYGPFVMTSQEEIMQAFKDLNDGKMGVVRE